MADLTMRRGLRVFTSGGVYELDTDYLKSLAALVRDVLQDRKEPTADVVHYLHRDYGVACGMLFANALNDDNSTKDVKKVSCKSCALTKRFRKARGEHVVNHDVLHMQLTSKVGERAEWVTDYNRFDQTTYAKACDVVASASPYKSVYTYADKVTDVTCKNCMRTNYYKKSINRSRAAIKAAQTRKDSYNSG